jgi:hypothetical protein
MKGLPSLPPFVLLITFLPTQSPAQDWDSYLVGQVGALTRFERDMRPKIQVGMTPNEVKQMLGRPQAIEGGFPRSSKSIIIDFPEQAGQMNNSTWFYFYPALSLKLDAGTEKLYIVNGFEVSENIFKSYADADEVYLYKGKVVFREDGVRSCQYICTLNGRQVSERIFDEYVGVDSVYIYKGLIVRPEEGKRYALLKDANLRVVQKDADQTGAQRVLGENFKIVQKDAKQTLVRTVSGRKVTKKFMPIVAVIFDKGTQVVASTKVFFKIGGSDD